MLILAVRHSNLLLLHTYAALSKGIGDSHYPEKHIICIFKQVVIINYYYTTKISLYVHSFSLYRYSLFLADPSVTSPRTATASLVAV